MDTLLELFRFGGHVKVLGAPAYRCGRRWTLVDAAAGTVS